MKKHIYAALMLLGVASFPAISSAQSMSNDSSIQPYIGAGLGLFGMEYSDTSGSFNKTAFGGYTNIGADVGDYFAAELRIGAVSSASQTYPTTTLTLSVPSFFSYLLKARMPATPELELYALVGATTAQFKGTNTAGFNQKPTKTGLSYGAGMSYAVQDALSVGVEWTQYWNNVKLDNTWGTNAKAKIWGITGTIAYHF